MTKRALSAFVAALLLAACGQTETSSPKATNASAAAPAAESSGQQGPCSWLTDEEISTNLGQPMKSSVEPKEKKNCNVEPADSTGKFRFWYRVADNTGAYSFMNAFKGAVAITNLGDKALWDNGSLAAVKGKRCVSVGISAANGKKVSDEELRHDAAMIANAILSRM